jgi:dolichyl-phosphate-mannose-protein mannosyltransferase
LSAVLTRSPAAPLLALVLLVATVVRLGFALRPPPFLTPDSQGYYLPGWELAHGLGFGPELRRTPGYPLFVAAAVTLLGDDLRGLVLAQHALGLLTAGLTFLLGRLAYGRVAGLLAGLGVALAGPLLIYEHYVLTEALFTPLLTLALLLTLLALRRPTAIRLVAAGLALAAATLTRPVADVLVPLLPLALLAARCRRAAISYQLSAISRGPAAGRRPLAAVSAPASTEPHRSPLLAAWAWYGLGLALLLLPWMGRNWLAHGSFSAEGALGQALVGRTARHDDPDRFYRCPPSGPEADQATAARRIICDTIKEAGDEAPGGGLITQRVRDQLGLSQAQTSNLLRQVAVEAILAQPGYFLSGTIRKAGEILVGKRETVLAPWRERTTRNWDNKWDPRLTALVKVVPPAEGPEYERADALVSAFQPWRWNRPLALLLAIGLLGALLRPAWRPALLLPLAAGLVVLASAALDGDVWRYRYPVDPLLAVTIGGGAELVWWLARLALQRVRPRRPA